MKIQKILSNNAVLVENKNGELVVGLGKGVGFGKKVGDSADTDEFESIFLQQGNIIEQYHQQLLSTLPNEIIQVAQKIVCMVESEVSIQSPLSLLLSLSDHLYFALFRTNNNLQIKNPLAWDLKMFYPKEYQIAMNAVNLINTSLNVKLSADEAGFIALHIISSKQNANIHETMISAELIKNILNIIKINLKINLDEDSLTFQRIVTHLKFFSLRMINNQPINMDDDILFDSIKDKLPIAYQCAKKIDNWLIINHSYSMTFNELIFLTIHIERLRNSSSV